MQTPTRPVAAAYPCAAWPAPCSWRTRMCRIEESISGSYAGRMAPPGMPKMSVDPAASSDVTRLCAPVICSLIVRHPCVLFLDPCQRAPGQQKTPRPGWATRGDALTDGSVDTSHAYKKVLAHAATVAARPPARHPVARPSHHMGRRLRHRSATGPLGRRLAPVGGADADLVAVRVGEHPERRHLLGADQGAAGGDRRLRPAPRRPRAAPRCRGGSAAAPRRSRRAPPGTTACCCGRPGPRPRGQLLVLLVAEHGGPERLDLVGVRARRARARASRPRAAPPRRRARRRSRRSAGPGRCRGW